MMRFRLLGPVEVRAGEDWRGIGAPKWRSVLAALLINSGQIVSVDTLISEAWRDDPPYLADQRVGGDDLPGVDEQRREHGTPFGGPDPPPVFPDPDLNRSEQTEPHHYPGSLASG